MQGSCSWMHLMHARGNALIWKGCGILQQIKNLEDSPSMHVSIPTSADQNRGASLIIRRVQPKDAKSCGHAAFEAPDVVAIAHNFPPENLSDEFSIGLMKATIDDRNADGAIAERDRKIVGSSLLNTFPPARIPGETVVHMQSRPMEREV
jgi:hypothetical protein